MGQSIKKQISHQNKRVAISGQYHYHSVSHSQKNKLVVAWVLPFGMAGDGQTKVKQARSLRASDLVTHIVVAVVDVGTRSC